MTDRELEDFIAHGENGFLEFAMVFGEGWAKQAIEIAKELRSRLAQPKPEPVAWLYAEGLEAVKNGKCWTAYGKKQDADCRFPLYEHPPQTQQVPYGWVTFNVYGEEDDIWYENPEGKLLEGWTYKPLYDTAPQQRDDSEPVAIVSGYYGGQCVILPIDPSQIFNSGTALYTVPPQREWELLTDEEIIQLKRSGRDLEGVSMTALCRFSRDLEKKILEKNR